MNLTHVSIHNFCYLLYITYTNIRLTPLIDGGGYATGYVTTAVVPAGPLIGSRLSPYGGAGALGLGGGYGGYGGYGGVGGLGLPPKIRAIFIPQGGAIGGAVGGSAW